MSDVHSKEIRSKNMSAIRSKGNKSTELAFLELLKENKIKGWRRHLKSVYGRPDFAFPKQRLAIFIDGCYWHGCKRCYVRPKTNKKFWDKKILSNKKRDNKVNKILKEKGWKVLRVWEHQINQKYKNIQNKIINNIT